MRSRNRRDSLKFDGKEYPEHSPRLPAGITVSAEMTGARTLRAHTRLNGKVFDTEDWEVSADGKTFTYKTTGRGHDRARGDCAASDRVNSECGVNRALSRYAAHQPAQHTRVRGGADASCRCRRRSNSGMWDRSPGSRAPGCRCTISRSRNRSASAVVAGFLSCRRLFESPISAGTSIFVVNPTCRGLRATRGHWRRVPKCPRFPPRLRNNPVCRQSSPKRQPATRHEGHWRPQEAQKYRG